jgi:hypothetical protein
MQSDCFSLGYCFALMLSLLHGGTSDGGDNLRELWEVILGKPIGHGSKEQFRRNTEKFEEILGRPSGHEMRLDTSLIEK